MSNYRNGVLAGLRAFFWNIGGRAQGSLSLTLVCLCVVAYVIIALIDRSGLISRGGVISYLGFSYDGVIRHLWIHQFFTAVFLHDGITHLLFNMLALWMLGPGVERQLGRGRYLFFSLLCAASGFAGFLFFNWGGSAVVIGYSGIIFGIMVAQAIFFPNTIIHIFAVFPLKMKHAVILLGAVELYLVISPEGGGVANSAHLFGALAAFVYLKLIGANWLGKSASNSMPSAADRRRAAAPRDWGKIGVIFADTIEIIASGDYAAARLCLNGIRIPWSLWSTARKIRRLISLAERSASNASDNARIKLERQVMSLWDKLVRKELFSALTPLATVGLQCGEKIVSLLVDSLCDPKLSRMPVAMRQALEMTVAETGATGVEAVVSRMVDGAASPDHVGRLLVLLPGLNLQQHAPVIMKFYGQSGPEARARLVTRLVSLKDNSAAALCDLLAGILNRLPADLRLAQEVQAKIGARELEKIVVRWASGGHRGAQVVMQRLYDYTV